MLGRISTSSLIRSATPLRFTRLCSSASCVSPLPSKKMATSTSKPTKVTQDSWKLPVSTSPVPELKVYNSLTRTKVSDYFSLSLNMTQLTLLTHSNRSSLSRRNQESSHGIIAVQLFTMHPIWDMRGKRNRSFLRDPRHELTKSHSNHRNYMAQDIMRRILRDYFGYEVNFVMNITDVDDKVSSSFFSLQCVEGYA